MTPGTYTLTAKATDSAGDFVTSTPVTVTVNSNHAPTVSLGSLGGSYTAPANIALTASAADSDGAVTHVSFYAGSTLIGPGLMTSGTVSSGSYVSNAWTNVAAGTYSVTAVATDEDGAVTISTPVTVTVGASAGGATGIYFINADQLGTPRLVEDMSQQAVWKWDAAEAFGDSVPNGVSSGGTFVLNLRFPGQYFDQETNTSYNYSRDYNFATGTYLQSDSIGLRGGINTYAYVGGSPVLLSDPAGENPAIIAGAIIGAIGGGIGAYASGGSASQILTGALWGAGTGALFGALGPVIFANGGLFATIATRAVSSGAGNFVGQLTNRNNPCFAFNQTSFWASVGGGAFSGLWAGWGLLGLAPASVIGRVGFNSPQAMGTIGSAVVAGAQPKPSSCGCQ